MTAVKNHPFICHWTFINEKVGNWKKLSLSLLPISVLKVEYQVGIVFSISNFFINKMYQYVLYLHSRRPSYESYQMDCFATFAKSALQIRLFWRNCKKWQNNPPDILDILDDLLSCPEMILHSIRQLNWVCFSSSNSALPT